MKIKLLLPILALTLSFMSCKSGGGNDEMSAAKNMCKCSELILDELKKAKEDPASIDIAAYQTKMEEFQKCIDPDGELQKKEEAMSPEDKKAYSEKMIGHVKETCPEVAALMGM